MTEANKSEYVGPRFSYTAVFERIEVEEDYIKGFRPFTALTGDTGHQLYWLVSGFEKLRADDQLRFAKIGIGEDLLRPRLKKIK